MVCERSIADLQGTIADLRDRQAENVARYERQFGTGSTDLPDDGEFRGLPFLVAPVGSGDDGVRPLANRPDAVPPVRSINPRVFGPDGTLFPRLVAGETYDLVCHLRNDGDVDLPPLAVEFFVDHVRGEVTLDRPPGVEGAGADIRAAADDATITGTTTLPPGTEFVATTSRGARSTRTTVTVGPYRTFSIEREFPVYDPGDRVSIVLKEGLGRTARTLDKAGVDLVDGPVDDRRPVDLSVPTSTATFVGRQRVRVPSGRRATARQSFTAPARNGAAHTAIYARAYALTPLDAPDTWGTLDPMADRHVARSEVYWA